MNGEVEVVEIDDLLRAVQLAGYESIDAFVAANVERLPKTRQDVFWSLMLLDGVVDGAKLRAGRSARRESRSPVPEGPAA